MQNNQVPLYSAYQPSLSYRLRHSKALLAILAVLGVTVVALAAALVLNRSDAQPGVSSASAPAAVTSPTPTSQLAATTATPAQTPAQTLSQQSTAPVVVAKAAVCADCGTVKSVTAVERQGQVNGMSVGNTTIVLGAVAGGVLFHF